jgi:hypothetical protein
MNSDLAKFVSYNTAKKLMFKFKLKTSKEFKKLTYRRPKNVPSEPKKVYDKEFISWADFLGCKQIRADRKLIPLYDDAKKIIKPYLDKYAIDTPTKWLFFSDSENFPRQLNIPKRPDKYYKNYNWKDWSNVD